MEWVPGDWMSRQRCAGRLGGKAEFVCGLTGGGWAEALCCRLGGSGSFGAGVGGIGWGVLLCGCCFEEI